MSKYMLSTGRAACFEAVMTVSLPNLGRKINAIENTERENTTIEYVICVVVCSYQTLQYINI